ncbi:hypothetical protein MLD38_031603 [Melastoma candidum]|uniref:Uncharacterized protein n=1 Tax=Melastoma candidum TaxID=119954 RepID=A0ACB9MS79_9MYRT|nr:hypothetical protein MLD38_031603 [Melastoma candidum]
MAELEARKLKYPNTCTEALVMGILVEGASLAAKFLRANGITLFKVREETVNLLEKSDMHFFSPEHPPLTEWPKTERPKEPLIGLLIRMRKKKKAKVSRTDVKVEESNSTESVGRWHVTALILSALHKCFLYDTGSRKLLDSTNFQGSPQASSCSASH